MGKRLNEPAAGYRFVAGGRIYKSESLEQAFYRITSSKLGKAYDTADSILLGAFTHLYDTNFAKLPGFGSNYVALGYRLNLDLKFELLPTQQYVNYRLDRRQ